MKTHAPKALAAVLFLAAAGAQAQVAQADVDHWTRDYDGKELVQSVAKCQAPEIPALSTTNKDIKAVSEQFSQWNECYEKAVEQLGLDKEPVSHIPAPIRFGMTVEQYKAAATHMDKVYAQAVAEIGKQVRPVIEGFNGWRARTEEYVAKSENDRKAKAQIEETLADLRKRAGFGRTSANAAFGTIGF